MIERSWPSCFFFQAEDGIRDYKVTGVQTCALPICGPYMGAWTISQDFLKSVIQVSAPIISIPAIRSEERRVGKECRSQWSADRGREKSQMEHRERGVGARTVGRRAEEERDSHREEA